MTRELKPQPSDVYMTESLNNTALVLEFIAQKHRLSNAEMVAQKDNYILL